MRIIIIFDVPMETREEIKEYSHFRKNLIRDGFVMLQKSVYTKICLNQTMVKTIREKLERYKPKYGLVQMLCVTEKQFNSIENIVGRSKSDTINDDKKVLIL